MDMAKPSEGNLSGTCLLVRLGDGGSLRAGRAAGAARINGLRQRLRQNGDQAPQGVIGRFALPADHPT
jgi:hypothetical protein